MKDLLNNYEHQLRTKRKYNAKLKKLGIEFNTTQPEVIDIYNRFDILRNEMYLTNRDTLKYLLDLHEERKHPKTDIVRNHAKNNNIPFVEVKIIDSTGT